MNGTTHLKVLHTILSLDCGGLERLVLHLCKEGAAAGDNVTVLCLNHPGELAEELKKNGIEVVCLYRKPGLMSLPDALRLRKLIKQISPDVIHSHQMGATLYVGTTARSLRISAVFHTEHGNHDYSSWQQRLLATIAFRTARKIYCVSRDIANNLEKHRLVGKSRLTVQANGIPLPTDKELQSKTLTREQLGIQEEAIIFGTVGRLVRVKRQERLLSAVAALAKQDRKVHLIIVGDGPLRSELKSFASKLEISHLVHFAGFQLDPIPYLTLLDIFVLTSDSEGLPMALLEAWAARKPVVATAVGGLPEVIEDNKNGLLLRPGDQEQLIEVLASLTTDPDRRNRLGNSGRSLVAEKYSAEKIALSYREEYLSLLH